MQKFGTHKHVLLPAKIDTYTNQPHTHVAHYNALASAGPVGGGGGAGGQLPIVAAEQRAALVAPISRLVACAAAVALGKTGGSVHGSGSEILWSQPPSVW